MTLVKGVGGRMKPMKRDCGNVVPKCYCSVVLRTEDRCPWFESHTGASGELLFSLCTLTPIPSAIEG